MPDRTSEKAESRAMNWLADAGREFRELADQPLPVIGNRANPDVAHQVGERTLRQVPVLDDVGDARWRARVVFEDIEIIFPGAHNVGADDMGVDAAGGRKPHHLRQKRRVAGDEIHGDTSGAQDFLAVVDVLEKGIYRANALFDPFGEA